MSLQAGAAPSQDLHESFPVTTLTVLILSLIPCVVVLLVLNCLFLVYKLRNISISKRFKLSRQDSEELLLQSCVSTRHRDPRITQAPNFFPPHRGRLRVDPSVASVPSCLPQPVTSSRTSSSKERTAAAAAAAGDQQQQQQQQQHHHHHQGMRFLRPDGATGTGPCSSILPNSAESAGVRTSRVDLRGNVEILNRNEVEWKCGRSAPLILRRYSDSDADTRSGHAPPNSPAVASQGQLPKVSHHHHHNHHLVEWWKKASSDILLDIRAN